MTVWLKVSEAAEHCRVSVRTFRYGVASGKYPPGHAVSRRRKVWSREELDAAISTTRKSSSDPLMDAIDAAEKAAAARRAHHR